ncbi:MAG: hypothetical protein GXO57_01885 [Thermodesulfobacteria bacterium]|nr:hypothetical protein [Thermodesulfobacteriota bacterium]
MISRLKLLKRFKIDKVKRYLSKFIEESFFFVVVPKDMGFYKGIKVSRDFSSLEFLDGIEGAQLKGKDVYLVLNVTNYLYDVINVVLPVYNEEVLKFKLKQQVEGIGFFEGGYEIFYKVLGREDKTYQVAYLALPQKEVRKAKQDILKVGAKLKGMSHIMFTSFSFCKVEGTTLVVSPFDDVVWYLLGNEKGLLYALYQEVDEFLGLNEAEVNDNIARVKEFAFRTYQEEVQKICILSSKPLIEGFELESCFGLKMPNKDWIDFAGLLGILFVDDELNFLPAQELVTSNIVEFVKKASVYLLLLSVIWTGAGVFLKWQASVTESRIKDSLSKVEAYVHGVTSYFPPGEVQRVNELISEEQKILRLPRFYEFLIWCARKLPYGTKFKTISVKLKKDGGYSVSGSLIFPAKPGEFASVSSKILKRLSEALTLEQKQLEYTGSKQEGEIKFKGTLYEVP